MIKILSKKQIIELSNLLHNDYRGCDIEVVKSKHRFLFLTLKEIVTCWKTVDWKHEFEHYKSIIVGETDGTYNSLLKTAHVYHFNIAIEDRDDRLYYSTFVLFHELRHHYQDKFNRLQRHDIEKDCNLFAIRMLNRHYDEIKKILK